MKRCSRCRRRKLVTEYTKNRAKADGLNHYCKTCHKKYTRKHYAENKERYKAGAKRRNREKRLEVRELLHREKDKPCGDCGESYPYYVMDFDHVRGRKKFNLAWAAAHYASVESIMKEIKKCDLVCANCHRIRTHAREAQ